MGARRQATDKRQGASGADIELGEDVTDQFEVARPTGAVVSARLDAELAARLLEMSEREGKKVSQLVREAVASYVGVTEKPRTKPMRAVAQVTIGGVMTALFDVRPGTVTRGRAQELSVMGRREKAVAEILAAEPMPLPDDPSDLRIELDNARDV